VYIYVHSLDNNNREHCTRLWRTLLNGARTPPSRHLATRKVISTDGSYHSNRTGFISTLTVPPASSSFCIGDDQQWYGRTPQTEYPGTVKARGYGLFLSSSDFSRRQCATRSVQTPPLSTVSALRIELPWAGALKGTPS